MDFLEEFDRISGGRWKYIRVAGVQVSKEPPKIKIILLVPYDILDKSFTEKTKTEIFGFIRQIIPITLELFLEFKKSYVSTDLVQTLVYNFLSDNYPSIVIEKDEVEININNGVVKISFKLKSIFYDYLKSKDFTKEIIKYMAHEFCNEVEIELFDNKKLMDFSEEENISENIYIVKRRVSTKNHTILCGKTIGVDPNYAMDCNKVMDNAVYCGKITEIVSKVSKKDLPYYIITLNDTTSNLTCKTFVKSIQKDPYKLLEEGQTIIARGKVVEDTFSHEFVLLVSDISFCSIDYDSIVLKETLNSEPKRYNTVFPVKYIDTVQSNLFETFTIPECIKDKTFVVFDFETTGLNHMTETVIELGAVKVVDGAIKESFSTFVNPMRPISLEITGITGISDSDVEGAPIIDDVIPDFYKFTRGASLVAHNAPFDIKFLEQAAKPLKYFFDNKVYDTLTLARKCVNSSNYKLQTLCQHLGISLEGAHRAVNDCEATAKLFLHIAKIYGLK